MREHRGSPTLRKNLNTENTEGYEFSLGFRAPEHVFCSTAHQLSLLLTSKLDGVLLTTNCRPRSKYVLRGFPCFFRVFRVSAFAIATRGHEPLALDSAIGRYW